jgi:putative ABC transport system permease protein
MPTMRRVPLAWCNLTHDPFRFVLFLLGIAFAVILMFVQLGFRNALLDSNTQLHDHLRCDLVLISPNRQALALREPFPRRRLEQARSVEGVAEVHALYVESGISFLRDANPDPNERRPARGVRAIGLDPNAYLLDLPELKPGTPEMEALRERGTVLFDRRCKRDPDRPGQTMFGPLEVGTTTELTGTRIRLVGSFTLGTDFTTDGTLVMNEETFLDAMRRPFAFPSSSPAAGVDLGLIRLKPGADAQQVKRVVQQALSIGEPDPDVEVFTKAELRDREIQFWLNNTPIGFAFGFGMFMGFAVGLVICYQILSGDVTDHLPEYATLKAIGYGNRYLAWVVLQEALILAVLGFLLGWAVSRGAYEFLTTTTGLPMRMTWDRAFSVFLATVVMCSISALVALVGLLRADPADVF